MRRLSRTLAALTLAGAGLLAATVPAGAATTDAAATVKCEAGWGSLPKVSTDTAYRSLLDVRAGRHECYDRLVFDVQGTGDRPIGYRVEYVDRLQQDGSGDVIPVGGGAILAVRVAAPSYDTSTGEPRYPGHAGQPLPGVDLTGFRTFQDTRFASSFEGDTLVGVGVRARLPFRVFQERNRIVVDVAHTW
ncbi:AMIN-like domain-containing (lipo)protein [Streptomyces telluris]|uniref:AMIN-like domain-containing protein n=1 Tax=Streptomyces telluris TaxID=2720021 RepID=A0A9X2RLW0_9ACTN|nr:hypothetical protein [Streptomyces telluris]MCQ8768751.1 hypothetical protein [Streptomyces telluris]NJP82078.1 hypothetical protein [Streptomyces telluris]